MTQVYTYSGFFFFALVFLYVEFYLFGSCICTRCRSNKNTYKRVDFIYSNNYDKIFIGVLESDDVLMSYAIQNEFNINDIDRFVFQKNDVNEEGFHLRALYRGVNQIHELCHIKNSQNDLEGLTFILNDKHVVNNINNTNNEVPIPILNECSPPPTSY